MAADYCTVETENGYHFDDPSEDVLFDMIGLLNGSDNTFITIEPVDHDPAWYATIAVVETGGYEIVLRDASRREHEVVTGDDPDRIAHDVTMWLAVR